MNPKHFALGLLALVLVVVSGCAPAAAPAPPPPTQVPAPAAAEAPQAAAGEPITLRFTGIAGPVGDEVTYFAKEYEKTHPNVKILVDVQTDDMNWQKTAPTTMFAAADGPDLSWWWCTRTTQYKDMIAADLLVPLDDLYQSEGWDKAFPTGTLDYYTEPDGHRYGVNTDVVWTPFIYYNKDIFKEVGVEPPKTWDDLYAISKKLRDAGYQPMSMVYEMSVRSHLPDGLMLKSWSEEEYKAFLVNWMPDAPEWSLKYKWTDPHGVRIYQTIKDMADKGVLIDGFAGITEYAQAKSLFTSGKTAMYQDGNWAGGVAVLPKEAPFDWGYFYYPPMDQPGYGDVGAYVANCYIVFKDRKHIEAAKDVVRWILQPENMLKYIELGGNPAGRIDLPGEEVQKILGPTTASMLSDISKAGAPALYESVVPPELLASLKQSIDLMLTGGLTPEEAAAMQQEATEKMRMGQ